jgi:hypothetical protein
MVHRPWRVAAVAALAAAVLAAGRAPAQSYFTDFESDPSLQGFYVPYPYAIVNTDSYSPSHSYQVLYGPIYTPLLTYNQGQFVEIDFKAKLVDGGQSEARPVYNSAVGLFQPGTGWTSNSFIFRADAAPNQRAVFVGGTFGYAYIDDVSMYPVTRSAAAVVQHANFTSMMPQPFTYTAPPTSLAAIPNTMAALGANQSVNAVIMGDSIAADTYGSAFESLVQSHTGGTINLTAASVGGAGPTYWAANNNVAAYVTPSTNLLMWAGISQQGDITSLNSIITQARAINPAIEIILMSPIAGTGDNPFNDPTLLSPPDPNGTSWRSQMLQLAAADGVQYWDMTMPWAQYIYNSGLTYDDFLRDGIHMNGRGEMLTAAIVDSYFSAVPEPSSLILTGFAGGAAVLAWRCKRRAAA